MGKKSRRKRKQKQAASSRPPSPPTPIGLRLPLALVLSGAASLVNEVAWTRLWSLLYGSSQASLATVLSVFMLGLGLGGRLYRPLGERLGARGLALYRRLEVGLAIAAVLAPAVLRLLDEVLLHAARASGPDAWILEPVRLSLAMLSILPPAIVMGATLPAVCEHLEGSAEAEQGAARLYAANTFGAVLGAVVAGYLLLPELGLQGTAWVAGGLSLLAAGVAPRLEAPPAAAGEQAPALSGPALAIYGFVGFWGMALEVLFARTVLVTTGNSSHALATVLGAFLSGIAGGSLLASRFLPVGDEPLRALGRRLACLGVLVALSASLLAHHNLLYLEMASRGSGPLAARLAAGAVALAFLLPAGLGLGAVFPAAVRCLLPEGGPAEAVGRAYLVNSVAGAVGAYTAHHWIAPWTGTSGGVSAAAAALLVAGALIQWRLGRRPREAIAYAGLGGVCLVALSAPLHLTQAGYRFLSHHQQSALERYRSHPERELLWYRDGPDASVAVTRVGSGERTLRINGKADASDSRDMEVQIWLGHLPLMLRDAEGAKALMLGLGAGGSADAMLHHPIESLEVAEISPTVAAAARAGFGSIFPRAYTDPRARIRLVDGRLMIRAAPGEYDFIVSEPTNVFVQGMSNLYSREFFEICRDRLGEDGLLVQWVQAYDLPLEAVRLMTRTLLGVFPHVQLYFFDDYILVASRSPLKLDGARLHEALRRPGVVAQLRRADSSGHPNEMVTRLFADTEALRRWAGEGPVLTDDSPRLEYLAAEALFHNPEPGREAVSRILAAAPEHEEVPTSRLLFGLPDGRRIFPQGTLEIDADYPVQVGLARWRAVAENGKPMPVPMPFLRHRSPRGEVKLDVYRTRNVGPADPHQELLASYGRGGRPPPDPWKARIEGHEATGLTSPGLPDRPHEALFTWACPRTGNTYVLRARARDVADDHALLMEALPKLRCSHPR